MLCIKFTSNGSASANMMCNTCQVFKMLRTDGERKAQLLKQAEKDRRLMHKQHTDMQHRLDQSNARLVQLTEENNHLKKTSDEAEKARLKTQNDVLQQLCRSLRQELKAVKPGAHTPSTATEGSEVSTETPGQSEDKVPNDKLNGQNETLTADQAVDGSESAD